MAGEAIVSAVAKFERWRTLTSWVVLGATGVNTVSWWIAVDYGHPFVSGALAPVVLGTILGWVSAWLLLKASQAPQISKWKDPRGYTITEKSKVPITSWILGSLTLFICLLGGLLASHSAVSTSALVVNTLWVLVILAFTIARAATRNGRLRAEESDKIAANRSRELLHAERLQRQQNSAARASSPGRITGYEPRALATIDVAEMRRASALPMYGDPGVGLSGSGFDARAVKRGAAGEQNFARALAKDGLLGAYASFWSVHMPETTVGASQTFRSDIDCVVVTANNIWLVDVKNYQQGGVRWSVETQGSGRSETQRTLIATDEFTGGAIGQPRTISRNMEMALSRFREKFLGLGVRQSVRARVVFMPQDESGLGRFDRVEWAPEIPALGLPEFLQELRADGLFHPAQADGELVVRILNGLLKDESGSAPRLGGSVRQTQTAPSARQVPSAPSGGTRKTGPRKVTPAATPATASSAPPARVPNAPVVPATPAISPAAAPAGSTVCAECGAAIPAGQPFCFECGASK